jgi:hypothetical protein
MPDIQKGLREVSIEAAISGMPAMTKDSCFTKQRMASE